MPDISGSRRRRRDIDSSGEADYELVTSTMPIDDVVDVEMMLGPENTTMGPRKMKRMMKRARKRKPLTQVWFSQFNRSNLYLLAPQICAQILVKLID